MSTDSIAQLCYWGGWVSASIALLYKLLVHLNIAFDIAVRTEVFPYHIWQLSFLLFIISIASASRAKSA